MKRIKKFIDSWYKTNIYDKNLENYVQNQIFCNDRSIKWGNGYSLNKITIYNSNNRINTLYQPSLICLNNSDKFTLKINGLSKINGTSGYGNNALNYPVGLITADEAALAGSVYNVMNSKYYLYTTNSLWTLTTLTFLTTYIQSRNAFVEKIGKLNNGILNYELYVRPVVNLKSNIKFKSGSGTEKDPYILLEN